MFGIAIGCLEKDLGAPPLRGGGSPSGLGWSASVPDRPWRLRRGSAGTALQSTTPVQPGAGQKVVATAVVDNFRHPPRPND